MNFLPLFIFAMEVTFFFWMGDQSFIEKRVYHVRDGEHSVLKTITRNSRKEIDGR